MSALQWRALASLGLLALALCLAEEPTAFEQHGLSSSASEAWTTGPHLPGEARLSWGKHGAWHCAATSVASAECENFYHGGILGEVAGNDCDSGWIKDGIFDGRITGPNHADLLVKRYKCTCDKDQGADCASAGMAPVVRYHYEASPSTDSGTVLTSDNTADTITAIENNYDNHQQDREDDMETINIDALISSPTGERQGLGEALKWYSGTESCEWGSDGPNLWKTSFPTCYWKCHCHPTKSTGSPNWATHPTLDDWNQNCIDAECEDWSLPGSCTLEGSISPVVLETYLNMEWANVCNAGTTLALQQRDVTSNNENKQEWQRAELLARTGINVDHWEYQQMYDLKESSCSGNEDSAGCKIITFSVQVAECDGEIRGRAAVKKKYKNNEELRGCGGTLGFQELDGVIRRATIAYRFSLMRDLN